MFGTLIIAYLLLGGAAGGAFFVMSAWSLGFYRAALAKPARQRRAFKALQARVYVVSLIVLATSIACLLWDLEYPERALLLFTRPRPTVLTFGAYVLATQFALGAALALANALDLASIGGRARKVLEALCCACSVAVMAYTGVFLASNAAVSVWNTWTLVGVFLFSSLSSGVSLTLLIDYFIHDQTLLLRAAKPLQRCHLACLAAEAAFIAAFVASMLANPATSKSVALLLSPDVLPVAVIGVCGFGIAAPFVLESYALTTKESRAIPVSDAVCLFGSLCLRWCVIVCGVH